MDRAVFCSIYNNFVGVAKEEIDKNKSIIVSFSGGADSFALIYCLLRYRRENNLQTFIHAVLIQDNNQLDNEGFNSWMHEISLKENNLIFHVYGSNVEIDEKKPKQELFRKERLGILSTLYKKYSASCVLTGHNLDDLVETTAKRIFESSFISNMWGMSKSDSSKCFDIKIVRPLLECKKENIKKLVSSLSLPFQDYVYDVRNQRDRLKYFVIPTISKYFGKDVSAPLFRISEQSLMLDKYLLKRTSHIIDKAVFKNNKCIIDIHLVAKLESIESMFVIKKLVSMCNATISFNALTNTVNSLVSKSTKKISMNRGFISILRDKVMIDIDD